MRRDLVRHPVPTAPGGGTVAFVDPIGHRYLDDRGAREEGGIPAIIEALRWFPLPPACLGASSCPSS